MFLQIFEFFTSVIKVVKDTVPSFNFYLVFQPNLNVSSLIRWAYLFVKLKRTHFLTIIHGQ